MSYFSIGDRVVAIINHPDGNRDIMSGYTGIVCVDDNDKVGVCWDNVICGGHSCGERCEYGHGWWVDADALDFDSDVTDIPFEFSEEEFNKLLLT